MGHRIQGIVGLASERVGDPAVFDLEIIPLNQGFEIVALIPELIDHWTECTGTDGFHLGTGRMICDFPIVHVFASHLGYQKYALIETEYFGGVGGQTAAVFGDRLRLWEKGPARKGPVNTALKKLGVTKDRRCDFFESVGLSSIRDFEDYYEKYWDQ